jgi:hypothetical protein
MNLLGRLPCEASIYYFGLALQPFSDSDQPPAIQNRTLENTSEIWTALKV